MALTETRFVKWLATAVLLLPGLVFNLRAEPPILVFDAETKECSVKAGEMEAHFTFMVTNRAEIAVVINEVQPSCGCTVAKMPSQPWRLEPGAGGPIELTMDLHGKSGLVIKSATVVSTAGPKVLILKAHVPEQPSPLPLSGDRAKNIIQAMGNRQAVFQGDCARCHKEPAAGKMGEPLYQAVCAICHESPNRASMVPDLHALKHPTDASHWTIWVKYGRTGSLMPAFAESEGGPLSNEQVMSLVGYLSQSSNFTSNAMVTTTKGAR